MRVRLIIALSCIFILTLQSAFAATIEKEFTFTLAPGETTKTWEVNVPLPAGETGKFIGRDFRLNVNDQALDFFVVKEVLSETNYSALLKMVKRGTSNSGNFQVTLFVGTNKLNDVPPTPLMVGWKIGKLSEINWLGLGDSGKTSPVSAKYFYYQLKEETTGNLIDEKVVPVYLQGFHFPVNWNLTKGTTYILSASLANISGNYSRPNIGKITLPK